MELMAEKVMPAVNTAIATEPASTPTLSLPLERGRGV
jgi:hypothetical protein